MSKYVIFDIDGTLADADHRIHHLYPGPMQKKNWKAFFAESVFDKVFLHVKEMNRLMQEDGYSIYVITGRPESQREMTEVWLWENGINYYQLLMRPHNDHRPDYVVKAELFETHLSPVRNMILCAFEDRLSVAETWINLGIPVFLCGKEWLQKEPVTTFEGITEAAENTAL